MTRQEATTLATAAAAAIILVLFFANLGTIPISFGLFSIPVPASLAAVALFVAGGIAALRIRLLYGSRIHGKVMSTQSPPTGHADTGTEPVNPFEGPKPDRHLWR